MSAFSKKVVTARVAGQKERQVFKHALAKPYTIVWPSAKQAAQEEIVNALCNALQPVSAYFAASRRASKQIRRLKIRRQRKTKGKKKHNTTEGVNARESKMESRIPCIADKVAGNETALQGRDMLKHLVLGINSTTRALEKQARRDDNNGQNNIALVVACKLDIESHVVSHLPALTHAARTATASVSKSNDPGTDIENVKKNASGTEKPYQLRLVGVAKGSEKQLAAATCQRRLSVIGIRPGIPEFDRIIRFAQENISAPTVPWVGANNNNGTESSNTPVLHPMNIHELHTTAPIKTKKPVQKEKRATIVPF
ncbi:RNase P and RNase MRP subunit [Coemansia sp. RSA 1813]|nr:RNase P and RNase MRP subunit [Coemansia sp. RSA 1646]KAJ2085868.1 RNase P and RNase MRP subunit [Coemansia sp. RSA 986]KAJ2570806.1 RNase P and RNase MRP subunit [Coemansia sp. RSA 1813]